MFLQMFVDTKLCGLVWLIGFEYHIIKPQIFRIGLAACAKRAVGAAYLMDDGYLSKRIVVSHDLTAAAVRMVESCGFVQWIVLIVLQHKVEFSLLRSFPKLPGVEGFPYNVFGHRPLFRFSQGIKRHG